MVIKTNGPINFQDIVNEFGGANPAKLSEYYRGGSLVPNTNANSKIATSPSAIKLSQFYGARKEVSMRLAMQGGGGCGGNGMADGNGAGRNNSGQESGLMTLAKYNALSSGGFPYNPANTDFLARVAGGSGGLHGAQGQITGGSGAKSVFGAGGAGGTPNQAAPNPTWAHWGAGGGGGGGDDGSTSYLNLYGSDAAGNAGVGALSGVYAVPAIAGSDLTIDVEETYVVVVGAGGAPSAYGNYAGGRGVPGYVSFSLSLDDYTTSYNAIPAGNGSSNSHYTTTNFFFLRIARNGSVYFERTAP